MIPVRAGAGPWRVRGVVSGCVLSIAAGLPIACDGTADQLLARPEPATGEPGAGVVVGPLDYSKGFLRRLTRRELHDCLADLLPGIEIDAELLRSLPDDAGEVFDNDASHQEASEKLIVGVNRIAEDMAQKLTAATENVRRSILGSGASDPNDLAALRAIIRGFGTRAFRRPLTDDEVKGYVDEFQPLGITAGSLSVAVERVVSSMLQDLDFVYRIERFDDVAKGTLTQYSIATRLSFLLWGSAPDDALLARATEGKLATSAGRREIARSMLGQPKARTHVPRFFAEWFGYESSLDRAATIAPALREKLRAESDELIRRIVFDDNRPWSDVFTLDETFIDAEVAASYGDMDVVTPGAPRWVPYGKKSERRGILGHGSLLSVGSKFVDTSPTQRGIMIRAKLLCTPPQKTPPDLKINLDKPPASGSKCKAPGYAALLANPTCGGCHQGMDPVGFGLERYDVSGRYRTFEPAGAECLIEGKGTFISSDGSKRPFSGPGELGGALIASSGLDPCLAQRVFEFAQGRPKNGSDGETLASTLKLVGDTSGKLQDLLVEIAASPGFAVRTPMKKDGSP